MDYSMNPANYVEWLKENSLFGAVEKHYAAFERIFQQCLGVRKEYVLIVGDTGYEDHMVSALMTGCYMLAAKRMGLKYSLVMQSPKKVHSTADDLLIQALKGFPENNVLAVSLSGKLGGMKALGKSFRKYARALNHRFVSTTGLHELPTKKFPDMVKALDVDYPAMDRKAADIKQRMDNADELRITTPAGTDLHVNIHHKYSVANTGNYASSRQGGNIPAGEVYIAPNGKNVEGKVVIDGSVKVKDATILVKNPVVMQIEAGVVKSISGKEEAEMLEKTLAWAEKKAQYPWGIRRLGEIGIGINPNASIVGPTIINEKTLGTAHIALGSNEWFGGSVYSITHFDQVFRNPSIYLDNARLRI